MVRSFFEGMLLLGVPMIFMFGPAFFSLIQTSIQRGLREGIFLAFGIILSDSTLVALSYLGVIQLLSAPENKLVVGIIGSVILVSFGVYTFSRKIKIDEKGKTTDNALGVKTLGPFTYILKGYFLNIANPFLLIFWMGAMGLVSSNYELTKDILSFFTGTLFTVFFTDILKCFLANRLKRLLRTKFLNWINKVVGVLLVVFGIVLIARVFINFS